MQVEPIAMRADVVVGLAVSATIALGAPIVLLVVWRRRTGAHWASAPAGAFVFFVSQIILRLPWQIPLGVWLGPKISGSVALTTAWLAASALTAGLFEEIGRWAGYRWLIKRARTFDDAVMYGIGHGGIESILLVGISLVSTLALYLAFAMGTLPTMPPEAIEVVRTQFEKLNGPDTFAGGVERLMSLAVHISLSVMGVLVWVRNDRRWLAYAIGWHFLSNFLGAGGAMFLLKATGSALVGELAILPFALASIFFLVRWSKTLPRLAKGNKDT